MCLSLTACGGDAPDKLKTIVIDDSIEYDYSVFSGTWLGEKDTVLVFEEEDQENLDEAGVERRSRMYFTLSDADDEWIATGLLQYSEEYGYVYAHNDYDGHAYRCQFDEDNTLNISSFGAFTKVSGDVPGEEKGELSVLSGTWYLDGDVNATKYIDINDDGTAWTMYEQNDDGSWEVTDNGTLEAVGDDHYDAESELNPVIYDLHLIENNAMDWGTLGIISEHFEKAE